MHLAIVLHDSIIMNTPVFSSIMLTDRVLNVNRVKNILRSGDKWDIVLAQNQIHGMNDL